MSKFFEETMQGLLEAVAIDKGEIPLIEKKGMTSPTFVVADMEKKLIDEIVQIRKEQNKSLWRKKKNTRLSKSPVFMLTS